LLITHDTGGIKAGKVERASRLELTTIKREWVEEQSLGNSGGRGVGCVVVEGYGGVVGVSELEVGDIGTVNLELELVIIVEDIECSSLSRGKVLDGVVEVEFLHLGTGRDRLLNLGDEKVHGLTSEQLTLLGIEVGIIRVNIPCRSSGRGTPSDAKLDVMILEGNERKGSLPVLTESETERVETLRGSTTIQVTGNRLGGGGRRKSWGDETGISDILFINNLTSDQEFNLGNYGSPVSDSITLETGVGSEVDIVEHVTLALKADGGHTVVRDVALNDLTLDSLGKIRMTLVGRTKKADLGLTDEVHILGSDGYELGDTTRHFII
jgi:hypothetical protein